MWLKISYVQHFTSTHLYLERHVGNMCKNILKGKCMCVPSCCACAHLTTCVRTHKCTA